MQKKQYYKTDKTEKTEKTEKSDKDGFVRVYNRQTKRDESLNAGNNGNTGDSGDNTYKRPRFVVTRNGAVALYNLGHVPIVLYADQWEKLESLIRRDILDNYMSKNTDIIKRRPEKPQEESSSSSPHSVEETVSVPNSNPDSQDTSKVSD